MEMAVYVYGEGDTSHVNKEGSQRTWALPPLVGHSVIDPSLCQHSSLVAGVRQDSGIQGP